MRYMPGSGREYRSSPLSFNATPMIDVIFLLTVFFMLVSRFASAESVKMLLPEPDSSEAKTVKLPERIVINCRPAVPGSPAAGALYSIGPNPPESLAMISQRLAALQADRPDLKVIVRADRRLRYADVRAVMREVARSGLEMIHVAAHTARGE